MNFATIKYADIANGEGIRTSLFVSGCRRGCPFCFNEAAWNFKAGKPFTTAVEDDILKSLEPSYVDGLTVLGGEPMEPENQVGLVNFLERVRMRYPPSTGKTIWIYTGDTYHQELVPGGSHYTAVTDRILQVCDVLVDGPFVQELYDISLRFRGSSNQRLIDLNATREQLKAGVSPVDAVRLWSDSSLYQSHQLSSRL
ncbi:anaerobic ribonucleoside-triphosphate reductase activating protein [Collinsella sp. zg1085]|uniref:anaerobic ribonucleoside-triphosphate reductase activating protein n=1 Tax=Collinsella sp. zg1085 TaxID=2844380 RepID=UPI001C0AC8AB|nr:anaerobic ribonucleoside-triphosphate reductase activating protein [Collinsella sp. zg1085]QWT18068.1 anaerobic ribonucleoside-triphosphate reductase activating protein [Collinsella sp. zg1085]